MNKAAAFKKFNEYYPKLKEREKDDISRIVNKLLQVNFLTKKKKSDANDYRTILGYKEVFEAFFWLIDFSMEIKREDEVVYIINDERYNHISLKKNESTLILILRVIFNRKQDIVRIDEDVEVFLYEIHEELARIGFFDDKNNKRITKAELKPALMFLKNHNIIDYIDRSLEDDARIKIYPTIIYATNLDGIKGALEKLDSYKEKGGSDEEAYED